MIVDAGDPVRSVGANRAKSGGVEDARRDDGACGGIPDCRGDAIGGILRFVVLLIRPTDLGRARAEAPRLVDDASEEPDVDAGGDQGGDHRFPVSLCAADVGDPIVQDDERPAPHGRWHLT